MKKINIYIIVGLILNSIFLFTNGLNLLPEFIKGLCAGLGITFILIGIYSQSHDLSKVRNFKKVMLNRLLSK